MKAPNERRHHMRRFQIEVIARPVEIRRHQADRRKSVLFAIRRRQLQPGNLRDSISLARGLQRRRQQKFFLDRLRSKLRIQARRSQKHQFLRAILPRRVDHIGLHRQIVVQEFRRMRRLRQNSAHSRRRNEHKLRKLPREETRDRRLIAQIQIVARSQNQIQVTALFQASDNSRPHRPAVSRYKNPAGWSQRRSFLHHCCSYYYWLRSSAPNVCASRAITCSTAPATSSDESVRSAARKAIDTAMLRLSLSMLLPANTSMQSTLSRCGPAA